MSEILFQRCVNTVPGYEMLSPKLQPFFVGVINERYGYNRLHQGCVLPARAYLFVRLRGRGGEIEAEEKLRNRWYKRTMRRSLFIVRAVCSPFNLQEINTGLCWNNEALAGHQREERMALKGRKGERDLAARNGESGERERESEKTRRQKYARRGIETTLGVW